MRLKKYAHGKGFFGPEINRTRLAWVRDLPVAPRWNAASSRGALRRPEVTVGRTPLFEGEGFVTYFSVPLVAKGQVKGVLEVFHRSRLEPDAEWMDYLNALAGQVAIAIDSVSTFNQLQRSNAELVLAYDTTIEGWSRAPRSARQGDRGT